MAQIIIFFKSIIDDFVIVVAVVNGKVVVAVAVRAGAVEGATESDVEVALVVQSPHFRQLGAVVTGCDVTERDAVDAIEVVAV